MEHMRPSSISMMMKGERFLEERDISIIEKKSLDEFFNGIAKESRKFGE
jgi:hypothetical protein